MYWECFIAAFIILKADYLVKCAHTTDVRKIMATITPEKYVISVIIYT